VQGWDRYAYVNNNPVKYNDPSGHTYCDFGKCHKPTGGKTNFQRAIEIAETKFNEKEEKGVTTFWWGLDEYERYTLEVGGWSKGEYNDYITTSNRNAYLWEDPAFYISLAVACGAKLVWGLILGASVNNNFLQNPVNQPNIIVLGKYRKYLDVANIIGGKVFSIPADVWESLSPAEREALNLQFLDEAIARGDYFYLASKWSEANPGSAYLMELEYLFSKGYTISPYQNYLIPPGPK